MAEKESMFQLHARKLKVLHKTLESSWAFANNYNSESHNINQLQVRLEELACIADKYEDYQAAVEIHEAKDEDVRLLERIQFKEKLWDTKAILMHMVDKENKKVEDEASPTYSHVSQSSGNFMKLPAVDTPKFNGEWRQWTSFIDTYNVMFHFNQSLAPVHRFHYLKSCLEGPARDVISSIPTTGDNYQQAYEALVNRYENQSAIIQSHIRSLFETPKISIASTSELQRLHQHVTSNINALKALSQPVEHWDAWLVTLVCSRLDSITVGEWHLKYNSRELPKFETIEQFLCNRIAAYEAGDHNGPLLQVKRPIIKTSNNKIHEKNVMLVNHVKNGINYQMCVVCNGDHKVYQCKKFGHMTVQERRDQVSRHRLCFLCLGSNHQARQCKFSNCPKCGKAHNSKLHLEVELETTRGNNQRATGQEETNTSEEVGSSAQAMYASNGTVMLATAVVELVDKSGKAHKCRALLDSGSQVNFMTEACAQNLKLLKTNCYLPIVGINSLKTKAQQLEPVAMYSRIGNYNTMVDFHVLPTITTNMPFCTVNLNNTNIPLKIKQQLADPTYDIPGQIQILLGAETFYNLFLGERVFITTNLMFHNTLLGWVLAGKIESQANSFIAKSNVGLSDRSTVSLATSKISTTAAVHVSGSTDSTSGLSLFSSIKNVKYQEELDAEAHFIATMSRDDNGKFVVRLPFKQSPAVLGDSWSMASKRFFNLERKFRIDASLSKHYKEFMIEYLKLGHMKLVDPEDSSEVSCFLPHHAVIKGSSLTTKTRVVFDASAVTTSGFSLNDILLKGPTVQPTLYSVLLRFRTHQVVLTADIEKMYRQVLIHPDDRALQKICYRSSPTDPLLVYKLNTVTYGTKSAPYLATRCLTQLGSNAPTIKSQHAICNDFYVDDLLSGGIDDDECYQLFKEVSSVLESASFHLRKWCTNSKTLISRLPVSQQDPNYLLQLCEEDTTNTLGITWSPHKDCFQFVLKPWSPPSNMTKRILLSEINQVYDPLGFLSPVLISGKVFLQQLWALKLSWDTQLPLDIQNRWKVFYKSLEHLQYLNIPRLVLPESTGNIQIHGFCDASQQAFGACVYIRSPMAHDKYQSILLTSKSRVAPMRQTTIPRLELCGAVLLAELVTEVITEFKRGNIHVDKSNIILWTDSTIVIAWINCIAPLKQYVANRVAQILDITESSQWRHVTTADNPADVISRGVEASTLCSLSLWWSGPSWLINNEDTWPMKANILTEVPECRPVRLALQATNQKQGEVSELQNTRKTVELVERYSSWSKLLRITAWLRRFMHNANTAKSKMQDRQTGHLTVNELSSAQLVWIRNAQLASFNQELTALQSNKCVSSKSQLKFLKPFIDKEGLLRVGGRLDQSGLSDNQKFPFVLPARHKITEMLFKAEHERLLHVGPQGLLAHMQVKYWPIRGRSLARKIVHQCIVCYKSNPRLQTPLMAPLPRSRITIERPFAKTGVDFCGPIFIRSGIRRVQSIKSYIAVFVCFVTRAVHLELVRNLTTEAFMAALSRFMARRGQCAHIFSDNGTNFVGAAKELQSYFKAKPGKRSVQDQVTEHGIQWHFNPPAAPHFGGLWEAAVKSAKKHLYKMVGNAVFDFEEMCTLLCKIEAVLNSRPLTPISDDPSEYTALTPAHFLIGGHLVLPPEPVCTNAARNKLQRWKLIQSITACFWKRWSSEYLPQLQRRGKWTKFDRPVAIGDLVLLRTDNTAVSKWSTVRVIDVHPGNDGIIRVDTLRTPCGTTFKRPVTKIALLPTMEDEESVNNDQPHSTATKPSTSTSNPLI